MSANDDLQRGRAVRLMIDAGVTLAVLMLAWAALDDITTDNSTDFTVEYIILSAAAMWLFALGVRLIRSGQAALGIASLVFLAGAVWGQRRIGPGTIPSLKHSIAILAAFAWTLGLTVTLFRRGWVLRPGRESGPER
jgi:hypothetical protein